MTVEIHMKRSELPIGDAMEEVLRYVLYHRRQVPIVVSALSSHSEAVESDFLNVTHGKKIERFRCGLNAALGAMRNILQPWGRKSVAVKRAAIVIGQSPSAPADVHMIEFGMHTGPSQIGGRGKENETASFPLSSSERRQITRQLLDQGFCYRRGDLDLKEIKPMKTYLLVQADRGRPPPGFLPRPDLDLLQYCVTDNSKRKQLHASINWSTVKITGTHVQYDLGEPANIGPIAPSLDDYLSNCNEDSIWYVFPEAVHGFDG